MKDPGLLISELKSYGDKIGKVKPASIAKINKIIKEKEAEFEKLEKISKAAHGIYGWVSSTLKLYDVNRKVDPLRKKVEEMTIKLKET